MGNFGRDFGLGFSKTFESVGFIFKNGVWWYYLFPLALNILIWISGAMAATAVAEMIKAQLDEFLAGPAPDLDDVIGFWNYLIAAGQNWLFTASGWLSVVIGIIIKIFVALLFAVFGGYLVIILMSPALAFISEHVEKLITGKEYPLDWEQMARDVVRGVLIALRNMLLQTLWTLGFLAAGFIPIVGIIAPFGIFVVGSYYYGFSFMDYVNERKRLSVADSMVVIRKRKGMAIANGLPLSLVLLIPFFGPLMATFVAVNCTVGASLAMLKKDQLENPSQEPLNIQNK